jgi:ABC-type sugar transport system ATPase subunit
LTFLQSPTTQTAPRILGRSDSLWSMSPSLPVPSSGLSIEHVSKAFALDGRRNTVLDDVNLALPAGAFGALIGPSGCGKSTLLRMVADVFAPSAGHITIDGAPPQQARREHQIGFVFQEATLLPWRSVLDNVRLPLELIGSRTPPPPPPPPRRRRAAPKNWCGWWVWRATNRRGRRNSPAACSSAAPSLGRWWPRPRSCCWTSLLARSTR